MILIRNLSLSFRSQPIFDSINLSITKKQRIGLFGLNGAGKSTLLRAIAGTETGYTGSITVEKQYKIGYMPQEIVIESKKSIFDETMTAFQEFSELKTTYDKIEKQLENEPDNTDLLSQYAELCEKMSYFDPEKKRIECEKMLLGLGFSESQFSHPMSSLSTGWKMRVVLAKLLLQQADFYLFDEPTNHLDMVAKEWFLRFLQSQYFGFLLVCHEKYFLNQLCSNILELERGKATMYSGNYDTYMTQKEERREQLLAAYEAQQREIKELETTINRFRAGTKAKMAQSMIKRLEKIERIEIPPLPGKVSFHFPVVKQSSRIVLKVQNLSYAYTDKTIFSHCSFEIERGNRVAIVAPNGAGKTTLINIISKKLMQKNGSVTWGDNVDIALFNQDQKKTLDQHATVFENAYQQSYGATKEKVRSLLGAFLFDNDGILKKTEVLSGGEQNRLGMVCVLLKNANVLILDEPTNHLDIPSKEVLLSALKKYEGTIIFVSHDHDFISGLATHILELEPRETTLFACDYETYLYQKSIKTTPQQEQKATTQVPAKKNNESKEKKKQIRDLEQKIGNTEKKIRELEQSFLGLTYNSEAFHQKNELLKTEQKKLKELVTSFEQLICDI